MSKAFEWVIEKLNDNDHVNSTNVVDGKILNIVREEGPDLSVSKTDLSSFNVDGVKEILNDIDTDFILHTYKEPFIDGHVFEYLEYREKVLGGFGDLMRVVNQDFNWPYLPPDVKFITRGLEPHTRVSNVRRLDNKKYEISRHGLDTVTIIALNDYDLGVESIRMAIDEYKKFDAILKSNPNGRISESANELGDSLDIRVFKWGELLGKLNIVWDWKK
jgi:hypothetical protein